MADTIPGNTTSTKTLEVGTYAFSAIDFIGDTDWWKVHMVYGYQYQVWIEGTTVSPGTLVDPILRAYNALGVFQLSNDNATLSSLYSYHCLVPSATDYFFLSAEESGNNATGSYTITLLRDELDTVATGATVAVNSVSSLGRIGWETDVSDWYAVKLTAGVQYQFDMVGSTLDGDSTGRTLVDPLLILRNSAGVLLVSDDDSGVDLNSRIFYTPTVSGTYYLDAQESGNNDSGLYRLIVNSTSPVARMRPGLTEIGSITFNGEANLYTVTLTAGVYYGFSVDGVTLDDPFLEVLDSDGTTVGYDDDSGDGLNAYLSFTPATSGTYFLSARESGNNATGVYSLAAWQLPTVSIADATVTEGNSGITTLTFTVTLSATSRSDVKVAIATSNYATASSYDDYVASTGSVTIAAGQTSATYTVQVLGDSRFEPTEALRAVLSDPIGAALGDATGYGYILDNDSPYELPTDPALGYQWYLYPGTGVNVFPVWSDYTGAGARVAVFDQGIDPAHPDLDGNLLTSLGRKALGLSSGGAPVLTTDNHGTAVAGTIAAERNGSGMVGTAYGAKLVSIYTAFSVPEIASAFNYATSFDVLNDSWGFAPQGYDYYSLYGDWAFADNFLLPRFAAAGSALENLANTGRHGLGTVVVQSAGNSFSVGDDTNLHNFQNSQYIITVAATDYAGDTTAYSSRGASVLVSAPGGGGGGADQFNDIFTTDRVGAAGDDVGDYTRIAGTSFSAPIVSGVVALMLEANPDLGYRDVQEILAYSARETSYFFNDWQYNGAGNWNGGGLHYDSLLHDLGFGLVDAHAAVRMAETWSSTAHVASNREQVSLRHNPGITIPDGSGLANDIITVTKAIEVERVEVTLDVTHPYIGDLSVLLTSPSGTTSFLLWRPQQNALSAYGSSQSDIHFTFDTVLNWGESSVGSWGLAIFDNEAGDTGKFDSWTLNLIGKPASADDTYIYTDEFALAVVDDPTRRTLSDADGVDTLNAAACSTDLLLDLAPEGVSSIAGRSLILAADTTIENAYGGDGNDAITGNNSANSLNGMRGDDRIDGAGGNDTIDGGAGSDTVIYSGNRVGYVIASTADGFTISSAAEGTDTVRNVEFAKFSDQTMALSATNTDHIAPSVLAFSPTDEAVEVAVDSNLVLTFNESIVKGSGTLVLKNTGGSIVESFDIATSPRVSVLGATLTIDPSTELAGDTGYRLELAAGTIMDLAGNNYAGTSSYNFSTRGSLNEQLRTGTDGNDSFLDTPSIETFDGGTGVDTVVFAGNRANYSLLRADNGVGVIKDTTLTDVVKSVERLQFSDGSVALDTLANQSGGGAALLLGAVLGHAALAVKKPLVGAVIDLFDQGLTLQQLSGAAMRLPIWGLLANGGSATASNTQIATYLLTTVHGTAPDAASLSAAVAALDTEVGAAQGNFLWHLAGSAANQTQVNLVGLYQTGLEFG